MKFLRKFYYFLGSVHLAIPLIAVAALFVVAGTFIESLTDSHRYAAYFTYNNPLFVVLLWGFFVNILISALRRWPFKPKHIPFLITHLGLLLVLGGTLAKTSFGIQGTMSIIEGSATQEISIPDTYNIRIDKRDPLNQDNTLTAYYPIQKSFLGKFNGNLTELNNPIKELNISIVEYAPHSVERLETWMKGHYGYITGLKPFRIYDWMDPSEIATSLPASTRVHLRKDQKQPWDIFAGRTNDIAALAKKIYTQELQVILTDTLTGKVIYNGPYKEAISWDGGKVSFDLDLSFSTVLGFDDPHVQATLAISDQSPEIIRIPLQGLDSLKNIKLLKPFFGNGPISIDLMQSPSLALIQDMHDDLFFFAFDPYGRVFLEPFRNDNLHTFIAYDNGFGGYAVQAKIPFAESISKSAQEQIELLSLKEQLNIEQHKSSISTPLLMLKKGCEKSDVDFAECCIELLQQWNNSNGWLLPSNIALKDNVTKAIEQIDWDMMSNKEKKACYWTHLLFKELEPEMKQGKNLIDLLTAMKWPLIEPLKSAQQSETITSNITTTRLEMLTQQLFLISDQLPESVDYTALSKNMKARLLSAHLRAYGIHLDNIPSADPIIDPCITLECPLTSVTRNDTPQNKLEDNLPKITLQISDGTQSEKITLSYDRSGQGLKWPVLKGAYAVRFQPKFFEIPYRIRLRSARQINYPNSSQPLSFESDLIVTDLSKKSSIETMISMNNVHETWEGYRFYLSGMNPPNETAAKRIHVVVNHDPAKYFLTYPGAIILSLGIGLLFWYRRKK